MRRPRRRRGRARGGLRGRGRRRRGRDGGRGLIALLAAALVGGPLGGLPSVPPGEPPHEGWIVLRTERGVRAVRSDGGRIVPGRDPRRRTLSPASEYRAHLIGTPHGRARLLVRRKTGGLVADTWVGPGLLAWSPDDRHLVVRTVEDDGLALLETDSGAWRRLTRDTGGLWDAEVAWAPDGGRLAVVARAPGRRAASLVLLDGGRLDLGRLGEPAAIAWTPDGRLVVAATESGVARLAVVGPDGAAAVVAEETGARYALPTPLEAGLLLVREAGGEARALAVEAAAPSLRPVAPPFRRVETVVVSPDGRAAALLVEGRRGPEVWIVGADRPGRRIWAGEGPVEILGWTLDEPPEPRGLSDYNYVHGP